MSAILSATLALAASPVSYSTAWSSQAALQTLSALRSRTSSRPLDLLEDLYDAESGLCSEGVWHNSWLGIGQIYAARRESGDAAAAHLDRARRLADSLHELNYEADRGFRSRTRSGFWQAADADALARAGENPAFYEPDATCRCSANAAAVILHTFLLEESPNDAAVAARAAAVFDTFTASFFDSDTMRWSREAVSGGGELRAADAAAAVLACLRLVKVNHGNPAISRAMASCAADALLRDTGFGYSGYASPSYTPPRNPLGASTAGRNSWHDAFVALALLVGDALGAGGDSADCSTIWRRTTRPTAACSRTCPSGCRRAAPSAARTRARRRSGRRRSARADARAMRSAPSCRRDGAAPLCSPSQTCTRTRGCGRTPRRPPSCCSSRAIFGSVEHGSD